MFPLRDNIPSSHTPLVVLGLIAANFIVFGLELSLPAQSQEEFFYLFGFVPARFTNPEWAQKVGFPDQAYWAILTSMFLHGGWLHILSNMWMLWIFGDNVEDRMGVVRFMAFYLTCGLAAAIVHLVTNVNSTMPTVGASGAIAGVMGAYFIMFPHSRVLTLIPIFFWPFFVEIPAFVFLGFWFVSQIFSGGASLAAGQQVGGIAWWAHIGGFVCGMLLYRMFLNPEERTRSAEQYVDEQTHRAETPRRVNVFRS